MLKKMIDCLAFPFAVLVIFSLLIACNHDDTGVSANKGDEYDIISPTYPGGRSDLQCNSALAGLKVLVDGDVAWMNGLVYICARDGDVGESWKWDTNACAFEDGESVVRYAEGSIWHFPPGAYSCEPDVYTCVHGDVIGLGKVMNICAAAWPSTQGLLYDDRDGQTYKTVVIGKQTWMAENLNFQMLDSFCYENNPANCTEYGRLYTWITATSACPSGWHLPGKSEWETLFSAVGGKLYAGRALKSTSGWEYGGNGEDRYAFSVLPAGNKFWTSTEINSGTAYYFFFSHYDDSVNGLVRYHGIGIDVHADKIAGLSVRCLKDSE